MNRNDKGKSLEETLLTAWHGAPVLKAEERRIFLGTFYERVITYVTKKDLADKKVEGKILESFSHKEAKILLVNSRYVSTLSKYLNIAQQKGLDFKVVSRKEECTDVILVIASDKAIRK